MRVESFSKFVEIVVREYDMPLYNYFQTCAPNTAIDHSVVLKRFATIMFVENAQGKTVDYVRELCSTQNEGSLIWSR